MPRAVFVYGTLKDPALVASLVGRPLPTRPARLDGFRYIETPNRYPFIEPDSDAFVDGVLLLEIDVRSLELLDRYEDEGSLYWRREVAVNTDEGSIRAWTYVGNRQAVLALPRS